jgi:hypothetical protein
VRVFAFACLAFTAHCGGRATESGPGSSGGSGNSSGARGNTAGENGEGATGARDSSGSGATDGAGASDSGTTGVGASNGAGANDSTGGMPGTGATAGAGAAAGTGNGDGCAPPIACSMECERSCGCETCVEGSIVGDYECQDGCYVSLDAVSRDWAWFELHEWVLCEGQVDCNYQWIVTPDGHFLSNYNELATEGDMSESDFAKLDALLRGDPFRLGLAQGFYCPEPPEDTYVQVLIAPMNSVAQTADITGCRWEDATSIPFQIYDIVAKY